MRASKHGSRKEETCRIALPYGGQPALIRPLQRSWTPHDSFMCTQTGTNTHTTTTKLTSHHKDSQCSKNIHLNRNRTEFFSVTNLSLCFMATQAQTLHKDTNIASPSFLQPFIKLHENNFTHLHRLCFYISSLKYMVSFCSPTPTTGYQLSSAMKLCTDLTIKYLHRIYFKHMHFILT